MTTPEIKGDKTYHVHFILDRSGSMSGKEDDVIGGFNSFIQTLKDTKDLPPCFISVTRFDTADAIETFWDELELDKVPVMTRAEYAPRGGTALLDAFGQTVSKIKADPDHRYLIITQTDGQENSSREWNHKDKIKTLIESLEKAGNWTFAYFGESQDAWANYSGVGMASSAGQTMSFAASAYDKTSHSSGRVSQILMTRQIHSTQNYGAATAAVSLDSSISDEKIAAILNGEDEAEDKDASKVSE